MTNIHKTLAVAVLAAVFVSKASEAEKSQPFAESGSTEEIFLVVGEQQVIDATDVVSFSESTRGVIEVKIPRDGRKMVVTAIRPGSTSLLLIQRREAQKNLLITVFSRRPEAIRKELDSLLGDIEGLGLRGIGQRIFIDGSVPSEADLARVQQVARMYEGQVASLVRIDPQVVYPKTNIRIDLIFVELRRSSGYDMGVSWPSTIGGTHTLNASYDLVSGAPAASYQVVDQALPAIEASQRAGWAKIRKRTTVVTTSGNRASYEAGGEVNVAISGSQAAELRSVPYGCRLGVLPRLASGPGILDLEVEAEVSDLTETTQDVPGRTISKVKTLVHLGLGQSIMLSGLTAESTSKSTSGLPGLSRIPLLGLFFGTNTKREEQVDGVIFITPTVLEHVGQEGKRLLEEALSRFERFKGRFKR